jgi:hypothetical protein
VNSAKPIVEQYLLQLRRAFYPDQKAFFQQRQMLIKAFTLPARGFDKSGVFLPEPDYRKLLDTIISGIPEHGDLRSMRHFGVYFLDCVQRHIKPHSDEYLDQAKGLQAKANLAMNQIVQGITVTEPKNASLDGASRHPMIPATRSISHCKSGATGLARTQAARLLISAVSGMRYDSLWAFGLLG